MKRNIGIIIIVIGIFAALALISLTLYDYFYVGTRFQWVGIGRAIIGLSSALLLGKWLINMDKGKIPDS